METFTLIDGVVALVVVISALLAYGRGLVRELMAIVGWVVAAVLGFMFAPQVEPMMREIPTVGAFLADSCELSIIAAFAVVFAVALIVVVAVLSSVYLITSMTALRMAELAMEAGIPDGIFNVLPGFGDKTGKPLALHEDVDCLAFTGSTAIGKQILQYSGQSNMKRVWLECGGKSPNIVFADCPDLDAAAEAADEGLALGLQVDELEDERAIEAAEAGARVVMLESAPKPYRGGNSRHTRNFRCMHEGPLSVLTGTYGEEEYFDDLIRVTKGNTDERLARMIIRRSEECLPWMEKHGVRFQPSLSGTLSLSRTNAFFLGGGKALVNAYYNTLEDLGALVVYAAEVEHIEIEEGDLLVALLALDPFGAWEKLLHQRGAQGKPEEFPILHAQIVHRQKRIRTLCQTHTHALGPQRILGGAHPDGKIQVRPSVQAVGIAYGDLADIEFRTLQIAAVLRGLAHMFVGKAETERGALVDAETHPAAHPAQSPLRAGPPAPDLSSLPQSVGPPVSRLSPRI